jgi:uncharacterized lipoprotein YddW (UPF0748 family)
MWLRRNHWLYLLPAMGVLMLVVTLIRAAESGRQVYLPVVGRSERQMVEVRGLWVTRFDWTNIASADPNKIDEIVDKSAAAGFNVLFFQVRGEADAYYTPGLEPWARRLSGTLGNDPGWDPLARLIQRAHQRGLQVHAYLNVYPVWTGCDVPPDDTEPRHLYHLLLEKHGTTDGKPNGLMWDSNGDVPCAGYQRVSPASTVFDTHIVAVTRDLVQRYDIDGLHLDHIRYGGENSSCDPVSEERFGGSCFSTEGYKDWQRRQVNGTVQKLYEQILSYYQDAKAWMADGTIDGVSPMIYSGNPNCDQPYFWTLERWQTLVQDYLNGSHGRLVIPGIGTSFCTNNDFGEIEARINKARSLGTAGHAIFSYKSVLEKDYFDDLANGPYKLTAVLPELPWR